MGVWCVVLQCYCEVVMSGNECVVYCIVVLL